MLSNFQFPALFTISQYKQQINMLNCIYEMFSLMPSQVSLCFQKRYNFDPLQPPKKLLEQLNQPRKRRTFVRLLNKKQNQGLRLLRKLCVLHYCLLHSPDICCQLMDLNFYSKSGDAWLNDYVIYPYQQFLQKIRTGYQKYYQLLPRSVLEISFFKIFLTVSLLDHLFLAVNKISLLSRYYSNSLENQNKYTLKDFVNLCAFHAQFLYSSFSAMLSQILSYHQKYVQTTEQVNLLRHILKNQLGRINQEMKNLFLHKDFHPLRHGYCIKLYRLQDQNHQIQNYAQNLYQSMSNKIKIHRKQKKSALDQFLFDRKGRLNSSVYQTLQKYKPLHQSRECTDTEGDVLESCEVVQTV